MNTRITRRTLLKGAAGAAAAGALGFTGIRSNASAAAQPTASAWVWQFAADGGSAEQVRSVLAGKSIGVIVKTHDGTSWMTRWDRSPDAVSGPGQVARLGQYFREAGVAFSAWCVPTGIDPIAEARMCSDVLASGPDGLYLDLEPSQASNFWQGSPESAVAFGQELRRLQPNARLVVAPDVRPWQARAVPMAEFAGFCNEIAPQSYWRLFDSPANYRLLRDHGFNVDGGSSPELVLEVAQRTFSAYGKPVSPIGEGNASPDEWRRFLGRAGEAGIGNVSVWRFGNTDPGVWDVIAQAPPPPPSPPLASEAPSQPQVVTESQAFETADPQPGELRPLAKPDLDAIRSNTDWWQNMRRLLRPGSHGDTTPSS